MAETLYAQTRIKHGEGGETKVFEPGEKVKGLPKEIIDNLKEAGAVSKTPPIDSVDDIERLLEQQEAEIARLQALLEEKKDQAEDADDPDDDDGEVTSEDFGITPPNP